MKTRKIFALTAVAVALAALTIAGCSGDGKAEKRSSLAAEIVDSVSSTVAAGLNRARLVKAEAPVQMPKVTGDAFGVADMIRVDSMLYTVAGNELIVTNLSDKSEERIRVAEPLYAVTSHAGKIYAGGEVLYELLEGELEPVAVAFEGTIRSLGGYGYRLMIGTDAGLYAKSIFSEEALFAEIKVTGMAEDNSGLWVATDGEGLYRWDGAEFKRRYLLRDTAVFDHVNALAFNHDHLFVGTDEALFVFDGGRWETVTVENGLPSNEIRSIDASGWVVYLATPRGVVSWFNYDVIPVAKIGDVAATHVRTFGGKLIVATETEGVLLKQGPAVSTLIEPGTIPEMEMKEEAEPEPASSEPVAAIE